MSEPLKYSTAIKGANGAAKVADCDSWLYELHVRISELEKKCTEKDNLIKELKNELEQVKKSPAGGTGVTWSTIVNGNRQSDQAQALMASVNKEITEKARIENNIIVSGVGIGVDDDEDIRKVDAVLKVLKVDRNRVRRQRRIKSSDNSERRSRGELDMIVLELKDEEAKLTALRNARNLRDTEDLKKVYVNPDKTPSERALERELRAERNRRNEKLSEVSEGRHRYGVKPSGHHRAGKKFYWGIRWNELREIYFD